MSEKICHMRWTSPCLPSVLNIATWVGASIAGRPPRIGLLRGAGAGRFQHGEWNALLARFADVGQVDYGNFQRVCRLVEAYLSRLAQATPDDFADADDQLAFYLNAYNAIAVHQVLLHYPIDSLFGIRHAFVRIYPVGRRNVSLHTLHGGILRAFGDPRIHAAICLTIQDGADLQPFSGANLQHELDTVMRQLLANTTRYDATTNTLYLHPLLRWFAGDFIAPHAMARHPWYILRGAFDADRLAPILAPYMPPALADVHQQRPRVKAAAIDWTLNDASA